MTFKKRIAAAIAGALMASSGFLTTLPQAHAAGLYSFSSFTFTSAGVTGNTGPTLSQLLTNYDTATNSWLKNSSYFSVSSGIQIWTVPETGDYQITAAGGQGAPGTATSGGLGAIMQGTFSLTQGQKLQILVGQTAPTLASRIGMSSAGGGGTFVVRNGGTTIADIIIIAGGGGGTSTIARAANSNAVPDSTTARSSSDGAGTGGSNGNAGTAGNISSGAGGGFLTGASTFSANGTSFINGGAGGMADSNYSTSGGGFGGGGSITNGALDRYAGGGGFNGGGSTNTAGSSNASDTAYGGGGSSYNLGRNPTNSVGNLGNGYVRIERYFTPSSITISIPANLNYGDVVSLVASTSLDGLVTFFARGKRIPNCINVKTSAQSATCSYKVATRNRVDLTATFTPNDTSVGKSNAQSRQALTGNRTTNR